MQALPIPECKWPESEKCQSSTGTSTQSGLSFSDSESCLKNLLLRGQALQEPVSVLVTGPPGSGKSTIVSTCVRHGGFRAIRLLPSDLAVDEAGALERIVTEAFRETKSKLDIPYSGVKRSNAPASVAVIFEDMDLWVPWNADSPGALRMIAALSEELSALHERPTFAAAFIGTACQSEKVHPNLKSRRRIPRVLSMQPLSFEQRRDLSLRWLDEPSVHNFESAKTLATQIASRTPGFMAVDLKKLFSECDRFQRRSESEAPPAVMHESSTSVWLREATRLVQPLLLTTVGGSLLSAQEVSISREPLYGLNLPIRQLQECLTSVFNLQPKSDARLKQSTTALLRLGAIKGLVLFGPSGSGKSAMARQSLQMVAKSGVNVLRVESASVVSSVVGEAERNITNLFSVARAIAPSVLFVENIDLLAPSRRKVGAEEDTGDLTASQVFSRLTGTFLTEIDGFNNQDDRATVFVMTTTKALHLVDTALLRPGRLEIHIPVPLPDSHAREQILRSVLHDTRPQAKDRLSANVILNYSEFAERATEWSAPKLRALGREVILGASRTSREKSRPVLNGG